MSYCKKTISTLAIFLAALLFLTSFASPSMAASAKGLYSGMTWYEHGLKEGLYVNPDLDYTITHEFQNETIPDIIDMAHSVEGFDINEFFKGTIYRGFSLEDFEIFYENGVTDMSELVGYMPLANSLDQSAVLTATADSTFKYFSIPAYNKPHGALYRLSLNGKNGLCVNYGKHSPNGTKYYIGDISKYATASQMENIKIGLLFALYSYNNDIGNGSAWTKYGTLSDIPIGSWTYLLAQVWTWCAMLDMQPMECARQFAEVLLDWGDNNQSWADGVLYEANKFLTNRYYDYYSVDTTLYTSNNDANQVIFVYDFKSLKPMQEINPVIKTSAINKVTNMTQAEANTSITIIDTVSYTDLIPGKEYTVTGKLMLRDTNAELKVNGKSVTATKKFTPTAKNGTINMEFTFDAAALAGKTVVVYEDVTYNGKAIASHNDIKDEAQSIHFAAITTSASDSKTGIKNTCAAKDACIVDKVSYSNLFSGESYELRGVLYDVATGNPLLVNGAKITATQKFVPTGTSGSVNVSYNFDASTFAGKTVVVFEELYYKNARIAAHQVLTDTAQQVSIPSIATIALDKATNSHHASSVGNITITDMVYYQNLTEGQTYRVEGKIIDRDSGESVYFNGAPVESSLEFIADSGHGSVPVSYELNGEELAGRELTIYEDVYYGDELIASHGGFDELAQVISVEGNNAMGDKIETAVLVGMGTFAISCAAGLALILKKRGAF